MNVEYVINKISGSACSQGSPFGNIPAGKQIFYGITTITDQYDPEVRITIGGAGGWGRPLYLEPDGSLFAEFFRVGDWYREGDNLVLAYDWFKYNTECSQSFFPPVANCQPPFQAVYTPSVGGNNILPPPPDPCAPNVKD